MYHTLPVWAVVRGTRSSLNGRRSVMGAGVDTIGGIFVKFTGALVTRFISCCRHGCGKL